MEQPGTLEGVQRYTIHGSPYVRVFLTLEGDRETIVQAQLPIEAFDESLRPGDEISVTMLMWTVMAVGRGSALTPDPSPNPGRGEDNGS